MHRVALLQRLDLILASGSPVGVLVLSLVRFAEINETYGADVGDPGVEEELDLPVVKHSKSACAAPAGTLY